MSFNTVSWQTNNIEPCRIANSVDKSMTFPDSESEICLFGTDQVLRTAKNFNTVHVQLIGRQWKLGRPYPRSCTWYVPVLSQLQFSALSLFLPLRILECRMPLRLDQAYIMKYTARSYFSITHHGRHHYCLPHFFEEHTPQQTNVFSLFLFSEY